MAKILQIVVDFQFLRVSEPCHKIKRCQTGEGQTWRRSNRPMRRESANLVRGRETSFRITKNIFAMPFSKDGKIRIAEQPERDSARFIAKQPPSRNELRDPAVQQRCPVASCRSGTVLASEILAFNGLIIFVQKKVSADWHATFWMFPFNLQKYSLNIDDTLLTRRCAGQVRTFYRVGRIRNLQDQDSLRSTVWVSSSCCTNPSGPGNPLY